MGQSLDVLAKHVCLRDPANPSEIIPGSEAFQTVARQALVNNKPSLNLPCEFLHPDLRQVKLSIDFLPIPPAEPTGLLLRLNLQPTSSF